jgi:magnesium transporter
MKTQPAPRPTIPTERHPARHSRKAGLPPGSLVFVGKQRVEDVHISVMDYTESEVREISAATPEECHGYLNNDSVTWINVTGIHDADALGRLAEVFNIHPLVMEDVLNTGQRPKFEDYGEIIFCIVKMLYRGSENEEIVAEQVSMVLGQGCLITFQEMEGDVFGVLRDRIRDGKGRIRKMGSDYLAYALLDSIVDNYFIVLEDVGDNIEELQEQVLARPDPKALQAIHGLKRDMIFMRKNLWPLRELVNGIDKSESNLITKALTPYLRDLHEHTFQVIDTVETWRDLLSGALDIYMTGVSNRMNEVMKVLTIIATIFIPLTFVAGIYGMNFEHMPELHWKFAYPLVWVVMLAIAGGMAIFFKRKRWW